MHTLFNAATTPASKRAALIFPRSVLTISVFCPCEEGDWIRYIRFRTTQQAANRICTRTCCVCLRRYCGKYNFQIPVNHPDCQVAFKGMPYNNACKDSSRARQASAIFSVQDMLTRIRFVSICPSTTSSKAPTRCQHQPRSNVNKPDSRTLLSLVTPFGLDIACKTSFGCNVTTYR